MFGVLYLQSEVFSISQTSTKCPLLYDKQDKHVQEPKHAIFG